MMTQALMQLAPDKKIQNYVFSFKAKLGKGAYGTVYFGRHEKTQQVVALKVIDKKILSTDYAQQLINQEIEIMKKMNNQHIVKLIDVLHSINNTYIITEYCNGGDLREYLKKKKLLSEEEALNIFKDIVQGCKDLTFVGIIHRDIKPANILLHDTIFKLTDFGFAREVHNHSETIMNSLVGTPLYMSPQILKRQAYTSKCDIWSLGLILYEMVYGVTPWHSQNLVELMQKLESKSLQFPSSPKISEPLKELIKQCLQLKEEKRIAWDQLFEHPLINTSKMPEIQLLPPISPKIVQQQQLNTQRTNVVEKVSIINKQRSNSNMQVYLPTKFNDFYLNLQLKPEHTKTEQSRERSFSTIDKLKIFEAHHTPPLLKNYNSTKNNNNDSSGLNSHSTNTTISSGRPRISRVNQFEVNFRSKANITMTDFHAIDYMEADIEPKQVVKRSIFHDIKIQDSRLKRTNSLNTKMSSTTNQQLTQQKQLQQLVRIIFNQLDLIPNHIEIKKDIQVYADTIKSKLQRENVFTKEDFQQSRQIIQALVLYLDMNKNDHFLVQMQVILLLLACLATIIAANKHSSSITLNSSHVESIKRVQDIQQGQLQLTPQNIQQQIVKYLEMIQ